jgi:hypothetical protein
MEMNDLVTVYSVTSQVEAEIIRGALESEGIACELGGTTQGGYAGLMAIDIVVRAADEDLARRIIQDRK